MRYGSRLLVSLRTLEENYQKLKKICPTNNVLFMVKADAYGHGLVDITHFCHRELELTEFGCATLGEALKLREELKQDQFEIYVFSDTQMGVESYTEAYIHNRLIPVIASEMDLDTFLSLKDFRHFPLCLKFNTGMNRLGIPWENCEKTVEKIKQAGRKSIYHLMTHFACASLPMDSNKRNIEQRERFAKIKETFRASGLELERTSISNSGAIEQKTGLEESHVRPGLMMYGPSSLLPQYRDKSHWNGKIISRLETNVIDVFAVDKGTPVGYGATPCPNAGHVAVIALGYGDGFSTRYQGIELEHNGKVGKVVGRVNMDMAQILFPSDAKVEVEDKFVVWDENPRHIDRISEQSKTIPYEIFCQLTNRVPRIYTLD